MNASQQPLQRPGSSILGGLPRKMSVPSLLLMVLFITLFLGLFILTFSEFTLLHLSQLFETCCIVAAVTQKSKLHGVAAAYRALAIKNKAHLLAAPLSEGFFASLLLFDLQPVETQVTHARNFHLQRGCPFSAGLCKREEGSGTPFVGHRSQHMTTLTLLFSLHKQKMSEICQTAMTLSN